jgi:hypothetical protein
LVELYEELWNNKCNQASADVGVQSSFLKVEGKDLNQID